jgi:plastocyanin
MTTIVSNICFSIALAFALCAGAATFPAASAPADIEVKIESFAFAPQRVAVKAGTTVTWNDIPHAVASSTKVLKSNALDNKDKYSFTFTSPGTYEYFCSLHPHMTGSIVVGAQTASSSEQ